jgi:hypothetical protein
VRTVAALCRTDSLHRHRPLGFREVSGWFQLGGRAGDSVAAISADAREVVNAGRELGLQPVLDSAAAASGGRAVLSNGMTRAA